MNDATDIRILHELIEALDRRAPLSHKGEAWIARDAAALRARALARIAELQRSL